MKKFITLILLLIAPFTISAEIPNENDDDSDYITDIPLDEKTKKDNHDRHRIPSHRNHVECKYTSGELRVSFDSPEGNAIITFYDITDQLCFNQTFSTSTIFTYKIGMPLESFRIEIVTSVHVYEGWLIVN